MPGPSLRQYKDWVRDYLKDWDYEDVTASDMTAGSTTFTVLRDSTQFVAGDVIHMDDEIMLVTNVAAGTITVKRGWRGTTAAAHATGSRVFKGINWPDSQLALWINESFANIYPAIYGSTSTTLTGSSSSYDYALPAAITDSRQLECLEAKYGSEAGRYEVSPTEMRLRGAPGAYYLYIPRDLSGFTMTLYYNTPLSQLTSDASTTTLSDDAKLLPVYYTAARALEQREPHRLRYDAYSVAQDERLVQAGLQIQSGRHYWQLFNTLLDRVRMPVRRRMS